MEQTQRTGQPAAPAGRARCVIAVPTFRRNDHLLELLPMLVAQGQSVAEMAEVTIVVVDNDPAAGAREIVVGQPPSTVPTVYAHEPTPGIAAARNRALAESGKADVIAFLDDDERPDDGWLRHLLRTWRDYGHASVAGRVVPSFKESPDPWIEAGAFFIRRSLPTGTPIAVAPAGNLLLDLATVRGLGLTFDPRMGLIGGEDTLLTRALTEGGGGLVFCRESIVFDRVPADRARRPWVLRRALSHGNTAGLLGSGFPDGHSAKAQVRVSLGGGARVVAGLGRAGVGYLLQRDRDQARGLRLAARGLGMAAGAGGRVYVEYSRSDGGGGGHHFVRAERPRRGDQAHQAGLATPRTGLRAAVRERGAMGSITKVRTGEPLLALTFDDGPDEEVTPRLLDLLHAFGATATFFVLVSAARRRPEILQRIVAEGHEVALHGLDHRRLTTMEIGAAVEHLELGRLELARLAGTCPVLYRPPYGAIAPILWAALHRRGLESVLWSATTWDWKDVSAEDRLAKIRAAGAGDIVLAHDGRAGERDGATEPADRGEVRVDKIELIEQALMLWRDRGLRAVTVSEVLRHGVPVRSVQYREVITRLKGLRRAMPPLRR